MVERPILFSGPMVQALREGRKTQTRRLVKPQPCDEWVPVVGAYHPTIIDRHGDEQPGREVYGASDEREGRVCPYGRPGDQLWVREGWKAHTTFDHLPPRDLPRSHIWYLADDGYKAESRTRASMHMPRWASRITLEITEVRVERLQSISEDDAIAEGCTHTDFGPNKWQQPRPGWKCGDAPSGHEQCMHSATYAYASLWDDINGAGAWNTNPWVWAVSFRLFDHNN
jgi:hypothetical protein